MGLGQNLWGFYAILLESNRISWEYWEYFLGFDGDESDFHGFQWGYNWNIIGMK